MAGQSKATETAVAAESGDYQQMLEAIMAKQTAAEERMSKLEKTNKQLIDENAQKDAVIGGLQKQLESMPKDSGTTEERKRQEALALRAQRAKRLSKKRGTMVAHHAVESDVVMAASKA